MNFITKQQFENYIKLAKTNFVKNFELNKTYYIYDDMFVGKNYYGIDLYLYSMFVAICTKIDTSDKDITRVELTIVLANIIDLDELNKALNIARSEYILKSKSSVAVNWHNLDREPGSKIFYTLSIRKNRNKKKKRHASNSNIQRYRFTNVFSAEGVKKLQDVLSNISNED